MKKWFAVMLIFLGGGVWGLGSTPLFAADLTHLKTAVIEQDFKEVKKTASFLLAGRLDPQEKDEVLYYMGISQLYLQEYLPARQTFRQLITRGPKNFFYDKACIGMIDSYYMAGDYQTALQEAEKVLAQRADSEYLSLIYLKLARINFKIARWKKASQYLNKIVTRFPQSPEYHAARQLLDEKQYFAVQVGSFLDRRRAQNLIEELKQKGEYAYIIETIDREGRKFYRVRLGQFSTLEEAQKFKHKLSMLGYPTLIYP